MDLAKTALLFMLASAAVGAQVNKGEQKSDTNLPFTMTPVTTFELPWRITFLPDGRMLGHRDRPRGLCPRRDKKSPPSATRRLLLARSKRHAGRLRLARRRRPAYLLPMPSRATTAAAWRWRARN